jgi:hypothetical protein
MKFKFNNKVHSWPEQVISLDKLLFWTENPRSELVKPPQNQDEFFKMFSQLGNVIRLKNQLITQEQLEPLIVKQIKGEYIVYEGNSRLAAMRLINDESPLMHKEARCFVAGQTTPDDALHAYVSFRHGDTPPTKKWDPFARALWYRALKKQHKTWDKVSLITSIDKKVMITALAALDALTGAKPSESNADRFSAMHEVQKHFQRDTSKARASVKSVLKKAALTKNYGGFGNAGDFRDALQELCKHDAKTLTKHLKNSTLHEIPKPKEAKEIPKAKLAKKRIVKPQILRKLNKIQDHLRNTLGEIRHKKSRSTIVHNNNSIKSILISIRSTVDQYIKKVLR